MRNFRELKIWQKGFVIAIKSYQITKAFPIDERFGLVSQINRAAVSISSNIAEGSSRPSVKEYLHFIHISLGSCYELETQLLIVKSLNYANPGIVEEILQEVTAEAKMLNAFCKALNSNK